MTAEPLTKSSALKSSPLATGVHCRTRSIDQPPTDSQKILAKDTILHARYVTGFEHVNGRDVSSDFGQAVQTGLNELQVAELLEK